MYTRGILVLKQNTGLQDVNAGVANKPYSLDEFAQQR